MAWFFLSKLGGGELAKFVVDQWKKPLGSTRVAFLDLRDDLRDFGDDADYTSKRPSNLAGRNPIVREPKMSA